MNRVVLSGSAQYRLKSAAMLGRTSAEVCLRRLLKGPRSPSWNLAVELGSEILKRQLLAAFEMGDVKKARSYLDSLALNSGAASHVTVTNITLDKFKGSWIVPRVSRPDLVILYLHGGGYAFYPKSFYANLAALISVSAKARLFTLDYRLSPEHRFPAQLTDAAAAYLWLVNSAVDPSQLVVLGDSAGGNLTLSLLLHLRDSKLPRPALAVCLSPATDFASTSIGEVSSGLDWITAEMAMQWADWFCTPEERGNPLVSPIRADLHDLPPIYLQAGGAEILLPSIEGFADRARQQGADISLEVWPEMNHDFQSFGTDVPQSTEAIRRIGEVISTRVPARTGKAAAKL